MEPLKVEPREHRVVCRPCAGKHCFGCREGSSEALGVRVYRMDDGSAVSLYHTSPSHQSFNGIMHGGITCTLLDEVCSYQTWEDNNYDAIAFTVEMNIKYFAPVAVDTDIKIIADPPKIDRRHYHVTGRVLLEDNTVAATAEIHYIKLKQDDERNKGEVEIREDRAEERETIFY